MWTDNQRQLLDALLDQLIPPSADGRVPGAGQLGIADYLAGIAASDDQFGKALTDALTEAGSDAQSLQNSAPEAFAALQRHTYMGYYSRSDTRPLFGVSQKPVHPSGYQVDAEPEALMSDLTAPVIARGRCYRDV